MPEEWKTITTEEWWMLFAAAVVYMIPTAIAYLFGIKKRIGILILNVFLGWTFVGWVAALIWAAVGEREN